MLFKIVSAESGFVFMSFSAISICSLVEACLSHATNITTETDMIMILLARNEIIYVVFFPPISARTILMAAKNADNLDFLFLNIVFYFKFTFIFCSINKGWVHPYKNQDSTKATLVPGSLGMAYRIMKVGFVCPLFLNR